MKNFVRALQMMANQVKELGGDHGVMSNVQTALAAAPEELQASVNDHMASATPPPSGADPATRGGATERQLRDEIRVLGSKYEDVAKRVFALEGGTRQADGTFVGKDGQPLNTQGEDEASRTTEYVRPTLDSGQIDMSEKSPQLNRSTFEEGGNGTDMGTSKDTGAAGDQSGFIGGTAGEPAPDGDKGFIAQHEAAT